MHTCVLVLTIASIGHFAGTLMSKTALQTEICPFAMLKDTVVELSTVVLETTSTVFLGNGQQAPHGWLAVQFCS